MELTELVESIKSIGDAHDVSTVPSKLCIACEATKRGAMPKSVQLLRLRMMRRSSPAVCVKAAGSRHADSPLPSAKTAEAEYGRHRCATRVHVSTPWWKMILGFLIGG